jgi:dTDP-4-dehydrorhamnose 3,5-epimerase-like enzyme
VESYQETWKKTGCTLMTNGWTNQKKKTLINLLVYCPKGTIFLKSVDASKVSKTTGLLYKLFKETVLYIRPKNIVHMVTENASN